MLCEIRENCLLTRGDSSASTRRALRADDASRCVGNGTSIVLERIRKLHVGACRGEYMEQGNFAREVIVSPIQKDRSGIV